MDTLWEILTVITILVVGGITLAVALVRGRRDKHSSPPPVAPPARETKTRERNTYQPGGAAKIDTSKGGTPPPPVSQTGTTAESGATPPPAAPAERAAKQGGSSPMAAADTGAGELVAPATGDPVQGPGDRAGADVSDGAPADETVLEEPDQEVIEHPESARGRMGRLRGRLAGSNSAMGKGLLGILSAGTLDEAVWEEVEDTLLGADLGVEATTELVDNLRSRVKAEGAPAPEQLEGWLHEELLKLVDPSMDRRIAASRVGDRPAVVMVVGVNGTGKTTTVGKLARVLVAEDKQVVLGAADTFRAAAADQLETWGARVGVPTVRSQREGADPAAVAFDAVKDAHESEADVVIIDTAGRLHNKVGLMDELAKVKRVIEKRSPIDECILVLDATTGQNGMRQAEVFAKAVNITGVALTKLDGTAKGGIVVLVQRELGVPVKLVGLGEGADDLAPFDPKAFVDAVLD
ncbi:signal recognition particle-docking protein FtsY [Leekyejoonella antrihumi]|uniref:Signal recognition particle receptor FtsY n=1 Tax=Leekyejoonella antrihumi TaxID=1660198 RepID=A0A563E090_9MICO|nr:signal recognition particle-docking protein FtsY [Leekyejoonella antrihumi]TWP35592.1 signal recognition particle-docking protein FtsY [Leekyejoonella antrihumi]